MDVRNKEVLMRSFCLLIALAVVVAGAAVAAQPAPLQAEKTVKYKVGEALPLQVSVGSVKISAVKITVGTPGGVGSALKAKMARMDPLTQTTLEFAFDAESPKGWGKWKVRYAVELLNARGELIDRFDDDDSYEAEAKTSKFDHVTLKAILPLIDSVRVKFQAAAD
jgi:hypothetical protein